MAQSPRRRRSPARLILVLLPVLGAATLTGCDDHYDKYLLYPLRPDWVVVAESLEGTPPQINPPGLHPLQILNDIPANRDVPVEDELAHGRSLLKGVSDDFIKARREGKIIDPRPITQEDRGTAVELMRALRHLAGRPRFPKVDLHDDALNARLGAELKLDRKTLELGSQIYRRNCLHCHGLAGDGRGPTGLWVNPHPRDFRSGAFKFTSSGQDEGVRKPRRDDLRRVLTNGIDGTAMPSFALMRPEDMDAVISYVIHLSVRGEAEVETLKELILERAQPSEAGATPEPIVERVLSKARTAVERWLAAPAAEIKPAKPPAYRDESERLAAAARGFKFFSRPDQCVKCHVNFGRDADLRYDTWGTIVRPRNLTSNMYAGGHRPLDFYYRIHSGIRGSGMPQFAAVNTAIPELKDEETRERTIWDLVAFVQLLPYPEERAKLRKAHNILLD